MPVWSLLVELTRTLVFAAGHICGNSIGSGVLAISVLVRLALLPITLRTARRMMANQARIASLAPDVERLRGRFGDDRAALAQATAELYRQHDITAMPRELVVSTLIQMPIGGALYRVFTTGIGTRVGFLWMTDLARPDAIVTVAAAAAAGLATAAAPSSSRAAVASSMIITAVIAWRLSASVGLYWLASNGVGVVQSLVLRRAPRGAK